MTGFAAYLLEQSLTKIRTLLRMPINAALQPGYVSVVPLLGRYADESLCLACHQMADEIDAKGLTLPPPQRVRVSLLIPTQYTLEGEDVMDIMRKENFTKPIIVWRHDGRYYILNGHHRAAAAAALQRDSILAHVIVR
jgi:hypothetical protein